MKSISLTKGAFAIVDDDDFEWLSQFKWGFDGKYASKATPMKNGIRPTMIRMHRFILNPPIGMDVDHADGNKLNNQRANLRICSRSQNIANMKKRSNGSRSAYKGVYWDARRNKFHAYSKKGGRRIHVGYFESEIDAAKARDQRVSELFGEFAILNFPGGGE